MINDDVIFLAENLPLVDAKEMDPDFNYAVSHNLRLAEGVTKDIQKAISPTEDYKKFEEQMNELREKHANKDAEGNAIKQTRSTPDGMYTVYDIPGVESKDSSFGKAAEKVRKAFKETIEKRDEQIKFLKKENSDISLMMVDKDLLPKGLSRRAMDAVFLMIKPE